MKKTIIRTFSMFLAIILVLGIFPLTSLAVSGPVFEFALNSDGATYSVTKCSWSSGSEPFEATIPSTYNNKKVVSISSKAFSSTGLLERLIIPDTITTIAEEAFYNNSNLEYISIPSSITSVGTDAFYGCFLCVEINNIGKWCNIDFANANANPLCGDGIYKSSLYLNNEKLVNLIIPSSVTEIKPFAFYGCYTIETLVIPDNVKSMGEKAFYGCESLKTVKTGNGLTKISDYAFANCDYLASVEIGSGVTAIGKEAFSNCEYLNEISLGENLKTIGQRAFSLCKNLNTVVIPDTVTSIGSGAFGNCHKLTNIVLSKNIQAINSLTFQFCNSLKYIVIPEKVKKINYNAFYQCRKLNWIALYSNMESFGTDAFYCTSSLENIFFMGTATQWENISIPESNDYDNQYILDAAVHYKCTETFVAPTCKDIGKTTFVCGGCQDCWGVNIKQETQEIPALGHSFSSEWTIDVNASCTKNGSKSRHCTRCNEKTEITAIPAAGHIAEKDIAVAATCTTAGKTEGSHCSICGATIKAQVTIAPKGHTPSSWITDEAATVNAAGKKHKECTECGEVLETATIKQLKCSAPKITAIANKDYGVRFEWSKVSGADSYKVYRKVSGGSYKYLGKTTKTAYADKTAKSGTKYYYVVKAVNEAGNSEKSASKGITFVGAPVIKTPTTAKSGITVKWGKVTGAEGYIVYRKTGSGSYEKLAKVKGGTKVSYLDKTAKKGKTYSYKVFAYKGSTKSVGSAVKTIKDKY